MCRPSSVLTISGSAGKVETPTTRSPSPSANSVSVMLEESSKGRRGSVKRREPESRKADQPPACRRAMPGRPHRTTVNAEVAESAEKTTLGQPLNTDGHRCGHIVVSPFTSKPRLCELGVLCVDRRGASGHWSALDGVLGTIAQRDRQLDSGGAWQRESVGS